MAKAFRRQTVSARRDTLRRLQILKDCGVTFDRDKEYDLMVTMSDTGRDNHVRALLDHQYQKRETLYSYIRKTKQKKERK